jgi:hypothetical protein
LSSNGIDDTSRSATPIPTCQKQDGCRRGDPKLTLYPHPYIVHYQIGPN